VRETVDRLAQRLHSLVDNIVVLDAVDSTHAVCGRLIDQMDEEEIELRSTLIVALRQSRGAGRGARRWESPAGGLYLSWVRSGLDPDTVNRLPMLAAAAARAAVSDAGVSSAGIKWPNDILVDGSKLAGILIRARHGASCWAAIGLGINLDHAPTLADPGLHPATAISDHVGTAPYASRLLSLTTSFATTLIASLDDPLPAMKAWRRHLIHRAGDSMTVRLAGGVIETGVFAGLTDEGFLRLRQQDGERIISGGDVVE